MADPLLYRRITAYFTLRNPDGADPDLYPDTVPLQGRVTLTPEYQKPLVFQTEREHIVIEPITARIVDGHLLYEGFSGEETLLQDLYLPVTDDERANQTWSWSMRFNSVRAGTYGDEISLPDRRFPIPAGDGPLDLAEVMGTWRASSGLVTRGAPGRDGSNVLPTDDAIAQAMDDRFSRTHAATISLVRPVARSAAAEFIAEDASVVQAAEDAVSTAVEGRDLLVRGDPSVPMLRRADDYLAAVTDRTGRVSWLSARESDGGPTAHSLRLFQEQTGVGAYRPAGGYMFAFTDSEGRVTDLSVRASDGQFTDATVERLHRRLASIRRYADIPWTPESPVLPARADSTALASWGSSTIQGAAPQLSALAADHGMSFYAGGKGSELVEHTAARLGAIPAVLDCPSGIPAQGSVTVHCPGMGKEWALLAYRGYVEVAGERIYATLGPATGHYVLTREAPGAALPPVEGVVFTPVAGMEHRNDVTLINVGKNNLTEASAQVNDPGEVARKTVEMFDFHAAQASRSLVVGNFVNTSTPAADPVRARIHDADAAVRAELGLLFLDCQTWVTSDELWDDVRASEPDFAPTAQDQADQALGNKPASVSADAGHFNDRGYAAFRRLIERRMRVLGWIS